MKNITLLAFAIVFCASCSLLGRPRHGELTRRFNTKTIQLGQPIQNYIAIEGYTFSPEKAPSSIPSKPKTFHDLTPTVQQDLVKIFGQKDATSVAVTNSILIPLSSVTLEGERPYIDDRTTFKKRIVFSVRNRSYNPADRIWKLFVTLTIPAGGAIRFSNSSALATDFEAIDIGNLSFNRKTNFSSELTAGSGMTLNNSEKNTNNITDKADSKDENTGTSNTSTSAVNRETNNSRNVENKVGGKLTFGSEFSSKEEVALKQRFVKLSGSVNNNSLSLYQESTSGIDLSGNIVADVEFSYNLVAPAALLNQTVYEFGNFRTGATYNAPAAISAKPFVVVYPNVPADIYGTISFEGVLRQVLSKDNTISESDDEVIFLGGNYTCPPANNVLLLSTAEVTPNFWNILNTAGNPIRIQSPAFAAPIDLVFRSFEDAKNFLEWMKTQSAPFLAAGNVVGGIYTILPGVPFPAFTPAQIMTLYVNKI